MWTHWQSKKLLYLKVEFTTKVPSGTDDLVEKPMFNSI